MSLTRALFFDDLPHNIKAAEALGVGGAVQIRGGLRTDDVRRALRQLRERSKGAAMMRAFLQPAAKRVAPEAQEGSTEAQYGSAGQGRV